jgi:hypothetical protein
MNSGLWIFAMAAAPAVLVVAALLLAKRRG